MYNTQKEFENFAISCKVRSVRNMPKYHFNQDFITNPKKFKDFSLVQIGRLYFSPGDTVPLHVQKSWFELTVITDGEGEVLTNGIPTSVKRGDIYISLPFDMHEIRSSKTSPMKYDFFSFFTDNETFLAALEDATQKLSPIDRTFSDERINSLICDAIAEFIEESDFSSELLYSIFTEIMIYLIRDLNCGARASIRSATQAQELCYQIMNYIDTHIYSIRTLEAVAERMNYNYSYLSAVFKKTTGNTLLSYYRSKRMEVAAMLILENTMKTE